MTDARPNPVTAANDLRDLALCWLELDRELTRLNGRASREAARSKPPLALDVLDTKRDIDTFTMTYIIMLIHDTNDFRPPALNTPTLLRALAMRIGHFTHNPDPLIAYEFIEELANTRRKGWNIARPTGKAWVPIDRPCFAEGCTGEMRVMIDRDAPLDSSSLANWRPNAVCSEDAGHAIDAKILAHEKA